MGFQLDVSVPVLTVFLQGIVSFFSPCVLPLLPLYISYLSGGTGVMGEDGKMRYQRGKVMIHTVCFVAGISFTFFLLGAGATALGGFFKSNQALFARIGGIIIFVFGLYQLGIFGTSQVLGTERRLPFHLDRLTMSPVTALIMGFTFSFAWTPCVGPALTSVLLMSASAVTRSTGFMLIGVYTLGFVIPFLAVGMFTTSLLDLFKKHRNVVKYTVKVGAVLMILMGLLMFTGKMNAVTGYLSSLDPSSVTEGRMNGEAPQVVEEQTEAETEAETVAEARGENQETVSGETAEGSPETDASGRPLIPALDFELKDQFGNTHTLADYKGKTIFFNFWATWCPPCRREMPDVQKLYDEYESETGEEVVVLGVAAPLLGQEKSEAEIAAFLEENGYTYPVLMDVDWELSYGYGVSSLPTTFMIDKDGNVFGYISGQLTYDMMVDIVEQTISGRLRQ